MPRLARVLLVIACSLICSCNHPPDFGFLPREVTWTRTSAREDELHATALLSLSDAVKVRREIRTALIENGYSDCSVAASDVDVYVSPSASAVVIVKTGGEAQAPAMGEEVTLAVIASTFKDSENNDTVLRAMCPDL